MALSKKKTILIAAAIVVLGIGAYFLWLKPSSTENISIDSFGPTGQAQATFLTLAAQLQPIAFDSSVLSDPRFMALVDIKTLIVPEATGRPDPFAPLAGVRKVE